MGGGARGREEGKEGRENKEKWLATRQDSYETSIHILRRFQFSLPQKGESGFLSIFNIHGAEDSSCCL